jgi:segregation and condensation protein B
MADNLVLFPGVDPALAGPPPPVEQLAALEACLFANPGILTVTQLAMALRLDEPGTLELLKDLQETLLARNSGLKLVELSDGWQLRTDARFAPYVASIRGTRPFRLSRAALETLSVVAYRQPIAKGVLDEIRGVDCGGVLRMLIERELVEAVGRAEEPGRPITYGTTRQFLATFGLKNLKELPTLKDIKALVSDDARESPVSVLRFPDEL